MGAFMDFAESFVTAVSAVEVAIGLAEPVIPDNHFETLIAPEVREAASYLDMSLSNSVRDTVVETSQPQEYPSSINV